MQLHAGCTTPARHRARQRRRPLCVRGFLAFFVLNTPIPSSSLAVASLGYHVLATDLSSAHLLKSNIAFNRHALPPGAGSIKATALDWTELPSQWDLAGEENEGDDHFRPPFHLIITADTIYSEELVQPLLRSLHALALESTPVGSANSPPVLVCLERRDPLLTDSVFRRARDDWGFKVQRVPTTKVRRAVEKGLRCKWGDEWSEIELWKLKLSMPKLRDAVTAS
jgi:hypothetical protein